MVLKSLKANAITQKIQTMFNKDYGTLSELTMASECFSRYSMLKHQCLTLIPSGLSHAARSVDWRVVMKSGKSWVN
jgi:hypothetical protein